MVPTIQSDCSSSFVTELKFVVPADQAESVLTWARARTIPDPYAGGASGDSYLISSLYFDTPQFDVFERNGSYTRGKYRIRRYDRAPVAFLERKLKTRGLVGKRRSSVPLDLLPMLASPEPEREWPGYWFHRRLLARRLYPICQISYRRNARIALTPAGPLRMTLDRGLRVSETTRMSFQPSHHGVLLAEDLCILELKYRRELPVLFERLIETFHLRPEPVSKYRLLLTALRRVQEPLCA